LKNLKQEFNNRLTKNRVLTLIDIRKCSFKPITAKQSDKGAIKVQMFPMINEVLLSKINMDIHQ